MFGEFTLFKRLPEKSLANELISQRVIKCDWMALVWQIADDMLNLPKFLPAKLSYYRMVGNFRGVQIFMDFVRSAYPRKITVYN